MYYAKLADYQEEDHDILILVLMEDTLRGEVTLFSSRSTGLNPCFNGRYSQSNYGKF